MFLTCLPSDSSILHFQNSAQCAEYPRQTRNGSDNPSSILHALRRELTWTHYRLAHPGREARSPGMVYEGGRRPELEHPRAGTADQFPLLRTAADEPQEGAGHRGDAGEDRRLSPRARRISSRTLTSSNSSASRTTPHFASPNWNRPSSASSRRSCWNSGKGFAFVARQQRISTETKDFFIDLVFYNYILKCFVLIDLKTGELTHQDIGQMDMYVRLFEDTIKGEDDNPTIGIILCTEKDQTVVKYSVLKDSRQLFASKYKLYLPTEEELRKELERERAMIVRERGERYGAEVER